MQALHNPSICSFPPNGAMLLTHREGKQTIFYKKFKSAYFEEREMY